jgi:hypothetical protein
LYSIVTDYKEGDWPQMAGHRSECFEVVSTVVPSNWKAWIARDSAIGISPAAWQVNNFSDAFYDHAPGVFSIFSRERAIILNEDP